VQKLISTHTTMSDEQKIELLAPPSLERYTAAVAAAARIWNTCRFERRYHPVHKNTYIGMSAAFTPMAQEIKREVLFPLILTTPFGQITLPDSPHSPYDFLILWRVLYYTVARGGVTSSGMTLSIMPEKNLLQDADKKRHPAQLNLKCLEMGFPSPHVMYCCSALILRTHPYLPIFLGDVTDGAFMTEFGTQEEILKYIDGSARDWKNNRAIEYTSWRIKERPDIHSWFHHDHHLFPMLFPQVRCRWYFTLQPDIADMMVPWCTRAEMREMQLAFQSDE